MIVSTTTAIEGQPVREYLGVVTGEAILGANFFKDIAAGFRDLVGGRSAVYERELRKARDLAIQEMVEEAASRGGTGVIGVDIDYETLQVGASGGMLMDSASGTAVKF